MSSVFRWQIVVPRLLFVVVVFLAAQYGLGRLARWYADGSLDAATHAPAELAGARVSLLGRRLILNDLRLHDQNQLTRPLVEIDRCTLDFATLPFCYKRAVVERGTVSGLRFRSAFVAGGAQPSLTTSAPHWFQNDAADQARRWLQNLDEQFDREALSQFESCKRIEELSTRWPQQAAAIDQRVSELKKRAAELQRSIEAAQVNPLRHVTFLRRLPEEVASLRADFTGTNDELEKLVQSLDAECRSIHVAGREDDKVVRNRLNLDPIDPSLLTAYLLQEQIKQPLNELVACLRWIRQIVPARAEEMSRQGRGEDIRFAGCRPAPSFLIRSLQLQGTGRIGGQPVEMRGTLSDYSNAPGIHPQPIRVRLKTTGSLPLELQATIDRTGPVARDELLVDCRGLVLSNIDLGQPGEFNLALAPSVGSLSISVLVEGEQLSGDIQLVHKQEQITPIFGGQWTGLPLAAALQDTLANLDALAVQIKLGGTLSEPTCSLWSTLGPAVAEAMDRALRRAGDQHARTLAARAERHVKEQLNALERQSRALHAEILTKITASTSDLHAIARQQLPAARISHEQLGRRLPTGSLFR